MTRMTGPDCVVMCNLINTHTHTHTHTHKLVLCLPRSSFVREQNVIANYRYSSYQVQYISRTDCSLEWCPSQNTRPGTGAVSDVYDVSDVPQTRLRPPVGRGLRMYDQVGPQFAHKLTQEGFTYIDGERRRSTSSARIISERAAKHASVHI